MNLRLSGIPAVIALVFIAAFLVGYRVYVRNDAGGAKARAKIESALQFALYEDLNDDLSRIREAMNRGDQRTAEEAASRIAGRKIEINRISVHGGGENTIVRADYDVIEPDGSRSGATRYLKFSHSPLTGWSYQWESTPISYWLALF